MSRRLRDIFLFSKILLREGFSLTPFNWFLLDIEEEFPVVHTFGYFDQEGEFWHWHEVMAEDSPYRNMLLDYQYLMNSAYGQSMCRDMFFR